MQAWRANSALKLVIILFRKNLKFLDRLWLYIFLYTQAYLSIRTLIFTRLLATRNFKGSLRKTESDEASLRMKVICNQLLVWIHEREFASSHCTECVNLGVFNPCMLNQCARGAVQKDAGQFMDGGIRDEPSYWTALLSLLISLSKLEHMVRVQIQAVVNR